MQTPCPQYPGFQTCQVGSPDGRCPGEWGQLNDEDTLACHLFLKTSFSIWKSGQVIPVWGEGKELIDVEMTMRRKEGGIEREENGLTSKHFLTWGWTLSGSFVSLGREGGITQGGEDTRYLLPFYIYIENMKQILLSSLLDTKYNISYLKISRSSSFERKKNLRKKGIET